MHWKMMVDADSPGLQVLPELRLCPRATTVLVVGEARDEAGTDPGLVLGNGFAFAEFQQVGADLLARLNPDIVISPLISQSFDCIDLAQVLERLGYRGAYRAMTTRLPSPEVIRHEIRGLCPTLQFDLTFIDR